ncbi:DUF4397 domain-containing protein [Clostridium aciditolerans]|uniref:DUF4397 domain-containing protein n=1 Tax=Clostridium aciditolerans TaxID=339861 RepID=A0A934HRM7_9CLOT|nr:DUF4397 domain-containing protein [Clostridium aciditolerans]MBI6873216.1 DUF4397 domain-containing protein [Clostridium aciditolerans]
MFYCPSADMTDYYYRANQINSYIRIFNASPNSPALDIYANGNLIVTNLAYKEFSQYIPVPPGNYNIKVYPSGQTTNPVIDSNINIPANTVFNIAIIGTFPNISLYTIQEPTTAQNFGRACIRFINLSPNSPAVDIKLSDGTKVFRNVGYKGITDYACIPPGTYTFIITLTDTEDIVLTVSNVNLEPNTYYTIYTVGLTGKSPALEAIVAPEPR